MARCAIFNDTSVSGHYGCTAVMQTLVTGLSERGLDPGFLWPVAVDWHRHVRQIDGCRPETIVVNGEGTIHHSADRKRTRDLCDIVHYARDRKIPAHLVNASISDLDAPALDAVRLFDTIHVRESASHAYLAGHGIAATVVPDLSLGLDVPARTGPGRGIMVTDSVFDDAADDLRSFAAATGADYETMKSKPSVLGRLYNSLRKRLKPSPAAAAFRARSDVGGFVDRLSSHELIVTGRFHSVLLAILTDTPFVALPSNTGKIEAVLMDCFGEGSRMLEPGQLTTPAFKARMAAGLPFTSDETAALARYRDTARAGRRAMFDTVAGRSHG